MGGTALDSKQIAKNNSAVESLADDASQTEQGRNMSPTAADDRTNIVPEDYLDAENINNNTLYITLSIICIFCLSILSERLPNGY